MPETLNRRQFLKAVGITAAGLGAAKVMADTSVLGAEEGGPGLAPKKIWWAKEVDKPTMEVDWKEMQRYKEWKTTRGSLKQYRDEMFGPGFHETILSNQKSDLTRWEKEGKSGYKTLDVAFKKAAGTARAPFQFRGPMNATTPADRGAPRYEGTPEENSRIITAAARHLGAATVGFVELDDETTRKLIYDEQPNRDNRKIIFENIDEGYITDDLIVIPRKARYAISYTTQMSGETMQRCPTLTGGNTTGLSYTRMWNTYAMLHEFIRGIGWNSYGTTSFNGLGIYPAMAVMAGLGEMSRLNRMITPEYGPMVRTVFMLTDLPLAPTKPISFGVMKFCESCKRCADLCPSKSIPFDKEPSWENNDGWHNPGHKTWFENSVTCRNYWSASASNCGICFSVCPYTSDDKALIHSLWKATAAITPVFDATITNLTNRAFPAELGKPTKSPESWWKNGNMPEYGINTMSGGKNL
jgi:epoxyqueuosine reductase